MKSKTRGSLLALAVVSLAISTHAAEPTRGGVLRFAVKRNFVTLNPFVRTISTDHMVRSLVYEGLLAEDKNLDPLPALAASWAVSQDGMTYTFSLRPGVKFHHGKPLSAEGVLWSYEYAQEPKNRTSGRTDLTIVERVSIDEPDRIRVRLKSPYAALLSLLAGVQVLPIVARGTLQPSEMSRDSLPPGTGPFRFRAWKPGEVLDLVRFDAYWQKGLPYLDGVRFLTIPDNNVRINAIRAGDLDMVQDVPGEDVLRIREGKLPSVGLVTAPAGVTRYIAVNRCHPPFNNLKVRQAFAYALDKQELLSGAYSGLGVTTNQKILPGTRWFVAEVPDRKQDIAKAKALLTEAGYPNGVKAVIDTTPGWETEVQIIQAQAKKAGIELEIKIVDAATYSAEHMKGNYQVSPIGGRPASDPDLAYYASYHSPSDGRQLRGDRGRPCYSNPKMDELLEEGRRNVDFQRRRRIYKEVIELLQEEIVDIPIGVIQQGFAFQSSVKNFEPTVTGIFSYGNGGVLKTWIDK
jgi:peptide/nickel transport system substrate-binding protein